MYYYQFFTDQKLEIDYEKNEKIQKLQIFFRVLKRVTQPSFCAEYSHITSRKVFIITTCLMPQKISFNSLELHVAFYKRSYSNDQNCL